MLLEKIQSPEDIKSLSHDELKELAYEIRARLIQVTSKTGGHVAPNLGTVELTLALPAWERPRSRWHAITSSIRRKTASYGMSAIRRMYTSC